MVSLRCQMNVKAELDKLGLEYTISPQGAIEFTEECTQNQLQELNMNLLRSGMELLDEYESKLIDRIVHTVIEVIHYSDELPKLSYEDIIGEQIVSDNKSILEIFSDVKGISIMQFIVAQKIERVKELLLYEDFPLSEIAEKLRYRNQHYLIAQFKKHTGLSPAYYRKLKKERNKVLQDI